MSLEKTFNPLGVAWIVLAIILVLLGKVPIWVAILIFASRFELNLKW